MDSWFHGFNYHLKYLADGTLSFRRTPPEPEPVWVWKRLPEPLEHLDRDGIRGVGPTEVHGPPGPCFSPGTRAQRQALLQRGGIRQAGGESWRWEELHELQWERLPPHLQVHDIPSPKSTKGIAIPAKKTINHAYIWYPENVKLL